MEVPPEASARARMVFSLLVEGKAFGGPLDWGARRGSIGLALPPACDDSRIHPVSRTKLGEVRGRRKNFLQFRWSLRRTPRFSSTSWFPQHTRNWCFDGGGHRAWSELFPESNVWGFDIDPTTVFSEGKITTFSGDQLSEDSLSRVVGSLPKSLDLIIDDGWHQPEAALKSMKFLLPLLSEGGYYVVEDIDWRKYRKVWLKVQRALSATFFTSLIPLRTNASERAVGGSYALFVLRRR